MSYLKLTKIRIFIYNQVGYWNIGFLKIYEKLLLHISTNCNKDTLTINTYIKYLQGLSESTNMPYVNITLDIGAAMNAYKVIWNNPDIFGNVVIHPGDFHFMKENFQVCINWKFKFVSIVTFYWILTWKIMMAFFHRKTPFQLIISEAVFLSWQMVSKLCI